MSVIVDIADAVATSLNAGSFSLPFSADRLYVPAFELPEMVTLHVSVVPKAVEITPASRSDYFVECTVDIGVQQKVDVSDLQAVDDLMQLVEEILDHVRTTKLAALPSVSLVRLENAPVFAPEHMDQWRQFTSVVTVTYRLRR